MTILGVISDTHGLLRPEAKSALTGCDAIIHAGDVGKPQVLEELQTIAPVTAIRGNVDTWATDMPDTEVLILDGKTFFILHDLNALELDPAAAGFDAVISGHSHKPAIRRSEGVLYLNPGSAGPRRFKLPIALAIVSVSLEALDARILELPV